MPSSHFIGVTIPISFSISSMWYGAVAASIIDLLDSSHLNKTKLAAVKIRVVSGNAYLKVNGFPVATLTTANGILATSTLPFEYAVDGNITQLQVISDGGGATIQVIGMG
jgi:hypothetical protein